jgi:hypothetical protein
MDFTVLHNFLPVASISLFYGRAMRSCSIQLLYIPARNLITTSGDITVWQAAPFGYPGQWGNAALVIHWQFFRTVALSEIGLRVCRGWDKIFGPKPASSPCLWLSGRVGFHVERWVK